MTQQEQDDWAAQKWPVHHAFGGVTYAISEESQKRWQDVIDKNLAKWHASVSARVEARRCP